MKTSTIQFLLVILAVGLFASCGTEKTEPSSTQVSLAKYTNLTANDIDGIPNPAASEQYAVQLFDLKEDGNGLTEKELLSIGNPAENEDLLYALIFVETFDRDNVLWSWQEPAPEEGDLGERSEYAKWKWTGGTYLASMYATKFKKWPANQVKNRYTDPCGEVRAGGPVYTDCFYLCDGCPPPYKGTIAYLGDADISLTCDCPAPYFIGNYFNGTGHISHLGNVTSEFIPCIEYITSGGNVIGYEIPSQCGNVIAENGDELYVDTDPYTMMLDFTCLCRFTGSTTVHFVGGTGRYVNATGTASAEVVQDLTVVPDVTTVTFEGELDY